MTATASTSAQRRLPESPALNSGDRMDRAEFERRYTCRPDIKKAELIAGVVYVASPVRTVEHADPHALLVTVLGAYRLVTPSVLLSDNGTYRCPDGSVVQPDVTLRYRDGGSRLDDEHYLTGVPELCAEVAGSSLSIDLLEKKALYESIGVREYIVWQTEEERIDWWVLRNGAYQPLAPDGAGVIRSEVFPGLALDVPALVALARESEPAD
jgi:Uma2 family endonuclease